MVFWYNNLSRLIQMGMKGREGKELKGISRALAWSGYQPLTDMHTTNRLIEKEVQFC